MSSWKSKWSPVEVERRSSSIRLDGWKSISRYLGRCPRTIQRWHSQYALPVRHVNGDTGSVFAYGDELDNWLKNRGKEVRHEPPAAASAEPVAHALDTSQRVKPQRVQPNENSNSIPSPGPERGRSSDLLLLADKMWESVSPSSLKVIAKLYRSLIDQDVENAQAFAGLARALLADGLLGNMRSSVAYSAAKTALHRALEIDPCLPTAKCAAAWTKMLLERDWQGARGGLDEFLTERPPRAQAVIGRALLCIAEGCPDDASKLLDEVSRQFELNASVVALHGWSQYLAGSYSMALVTVTEARYKGHTGAVLDAVEALASMHADEHGACIARMETLVDLSQHHRTLDGVLGYAYAVAGESERARQILNTLKRTEVQARENHAYPIALVLIGLNEPQPAVQWLEQSYREGSLWSLGFRIDPILDPLRNHPAYQLFMSRVKYPVIKPAVSPAATPEKGDATGHA